MGQPRSGPQSSHSHRSPQPKHRTFSINPAGNKSYIHTVMTATFDRDTVLKALQRLSDLLGQRGARGEICLLGGTAMIVAFKALF